MNTLPPNPTAKPGTSPYTFKYFCQHVLPAVYDDSLSYYELLCKLTSKINEVITAEGTQNAAITEIQDLYVQLKEYNENYFKNLDIQEQINAKLDELGEKGELAALISLYLNGINVYAFKTKSDMKNAETIGIGSICKTLGSTDYKDGDGDYYYIRAIQSNDEIDDENIIALTNNLNAVAEKIPNKYPNDIAEILETHAENIQSLSTLHANEVGNLTHLITQNKTNVVGAVNETYNKINSSIIDTVGMLSDLNTSEQDNIAASINEVLDEINTTKANLASVSASIIPINRGGTGATTAEEAVLNLGIMQAHNIWGGYSTGTITFPEDKTLNHYEYIQILFCSNNDEYNSVFFQHWDNHYVTLNITHHGDEAGVSCYHKFALLHITDSAITRYKTTEVKIMTNGSNVVSENHDYIRIQNIIGYDFNIIDD